RVKMRVMSSFVKMPSIHITEEMLEAPPPFWLSPG
ncbi:MAG: hypothetical protein JWM74_2612, partial [Myxococcaceae bacterium]|nr:hypothetical protein [Myxococcaceae bacterium]